MDAKSVNWDVVDYVLTANGNLNPFPIEASFEIGDWYSFISATSSFNSTKDSQVRVPDSSTYVLEHDIELSSGAVHLQQEETVQDASIEREISLTATEPIYLGDLVMRFVFQEEEKLKAIINGQEYEHRGSNYYYQYPVTKVQIKGSSGTFTIGLEDYEIPENMEMFMYVRDEPPDRWIVHIRALSMNTAYGIVRLYLPPFLNSRYLDYVVNKSSYLQSKLRYIRENLHIDSKFIPIQYVEQTCIHKSDPLSISATGTYSFN